MIVPKYIMDELQRPSPFGIAQKIGFCSGSFDLVHAGHILFFKDCRSLCDKLIVMIGSDSIIHKMKGVNRPILNEQVRLYTIQNLKPVSHAFIDTYAEGDELEHLYKVIETIRPDLYFTTTDSYKLKERRKSLQNKTSIITLDRWCPDEFEDISTTRIIEKIRDKNIKD